MLILRILRNQWYLCVLNLNIYQNTCSSKGNELKLKVRILKVLLANIDYEFYVTEFYKYYAIFLVIVYTF